MHDKKYWKTANESDVNNFLDSNNNNKFKTNIAFTKFGVGKRECPGSGLTKYLMFMFINLYRKNIKLNQMPHWFYMIYRLSNIFFTN